MNQDIMNGKWKEIKGEIRKMWGNVTGDELEQVKGDMTSISGLIQQRYGHKKEEVSEKLSDLAARFKTKFEAPQDDLKDTADKTIADVKDFAAKKTKDTKDALRN